MNSSQWALFVGAVLLLWMVTPHTASAAESRCGAAPAMVEPSPEARQAYEVALELTRNERYDEALAAYQNAYDLSPSYVILFNIGKAAELTGDPARALHAYECHLEHGGAEIDASRRAEVTALIKAVKKKVGQVVIEVDEAGARIEMDGTFLGKAPLEGPVPANPGAHLVRVAGTKTSSRSIEVVAGVASVVTVELGATSDKPGAPFRFPTGVIGAAWITVGFLGVATAVTGAFAIVGAKDLEDDVYLGPAFSPPAGSELEEKVDRTEALAVATDVLLTAFIVTTSAAITFSIVNAVNKDDKPAVSLVLSPAHAGLIVALP